MRKLIKGGLVVTEESVLEADLLVDGEEIASIGPWGEMNEADEVIDASGCYVLPGGVDAHVHFGGFGPPTIADDFYTGSKAALAGGTTTVVDFCERTEGDAPLDCIAKRKEELSVSAVDYTFHYTISEDYKNELPYLDVITEKEGLSNFKTYTCYSGTELTPGDLYEVMQAVRDKGTLLVHAEEHTIIDNLREKARERKDDFTMLSLTRPNVAELIAAEQVMEIAKETGADVCIAHTSAKETVDLLRRTRKEGNTKFHLESCPHYMAFTREQLSGPDGCLYTMCPPLRGEEDKEALLQAILSGDVEILSTDHCPYHTEDKRGKDLYTVPCGVDGVQTRMSFLFSEGVVKREMDPVLFAKVTATNAAKFCNLYPKKGTLREGSDADIVLMKASDEKKYSRNDIAGGSDYTIYEGYGFSCSVEKVLRRGELVFDGKDVKAEKGSGQFLRTAYHAN